MVEETKTFIDRAPPVKEREGHDAIRTFRSRVKVTQPDNDTGRRLIIPFRITRITKEVVGEAIQTSGGTAAWATPLELRREAVSSSGRISVVGRFATTGKFGRL
jgi:hypothetical protein